MALFDDLIPKQNQPAKTGLFDDLVPEEKGIVDRIGDVLGRLGERFTLGTVAPIAGTQQMLGEVADQFSPIGVLRRVSQEVTAGDQTQALRRAYADPIGTQAFARQGAAVTDEIASERAAVQARTAARPASIGEAITNPIAAADYYGGILAESAPAILGAIATRNPELASAVIGTATGGQTYGQARQEGQGIIPALGEALASGSIETVLGRVPLGEAFTPGLRRFVTTPLSEAGTEAATEIGQGAVEQFARGQNIDIASLIPQAIDAAIVGGAAGVGEAALGGGRPPVAESSPPIGDSFADLIPEVTPEQAAQTLGLRGERGPEATRPAPVPAAAPIAEVAPVQPVEPAPIDIPREDTADLDAALAQVEPQPEPVRRIDEVEGARLNELRALRREGTITPEQSAELLDLAERDRLVSRVAGRRIPGVLNMEARAEAEQAGALKPVQAFADADNFKAVNDRLGHEVGDDVIRQMGSLFAEQLGEGNVFHRGGDEYVMQADTPEQLDAAMQAVRQKLADSVLRVTLDDGTVVEQKGVGFSYGSAPTIQEAENAQYRDKEARKAAGLRTDRTSQPVASDRAVGEGRQEAGEGAVDRAPEVIREAVTRTLGRAADRVSYVGSVAELPPNLREGVESRQAQRGGRGQTAAVYDPTTQRVFLLTDAVKSPERAAWHAAHEIAGHHGLRAFLGERLDSALNVAMQNPTVKSVADAIAKERNLRGDQRFLATEEALAELAAAVRTGDFAEIESRYKVPVPEGIRASVKAAIDNFVKRMKAMMDDLFGRHVFSDEDVRALLENAWQAAQGETTIIDGAPLESMAEPLESTRRTPAEAERDAEARRQEAAQTLPSQRGVRGWNYDESVWEGAKGALRKAQVSLQDKMAGWRDVQEQIASQVGQAIPDAQNVYQAENLMHGRVSEQIDRLERDQIKPLVSAMRKAGVSVETLEQYLYARHAKERNAQVAKINPGMQDGGSGMTNAEADAILNGADKEKLDPLARQVDAITKGTRLRLLEHGLIDRSAYDAMESAYSAYVPLRGKEGVSSGQGTGRGLDTRGAPTKRALGRGSKAENILGEVIGDAQRSIIAAEKARVGRTLMRLVLANPNPNLWTVEPVQTERKLDSTGEVYTAVINDWSDPAVIGVRHNGRLYKVEVQNPILAQALNNVGVDSLDGIYRAAGALNRYFSAILTKYNPAFTGVNATRDALFGLTGMAAEHGERAALEAAIAYPQAAVASARAAFGKYDAGNEWDRHAREFAEAGGKTGYVNLPSVEDLQAKIGNGKLTSYNPAGIARAASVVADAIGGVNDAVENALRLSAYVTLRKRGASKEKAATYAKNLTVNFNRKGLNGTKLNALFLFYNASLQGGTRVVTLLKKPKTWAYLGALSAAQMAATLAMLGMEDEDGIPMWDKVPEHVKARNIVVPLKDGHFFTIPMPYGFNLFTWLSGRMTDALSRPNKKGNDAANITADTISNAVQSFSPVPLDDGAMGLIPTALRIPLNIQTNRDDFERQIRKENPYSTWAVPRASMGRADTLEVFKLTAKALSRVGGGDDYTPPPLSMFDVAPEDLEYLLGELTGGAGQFVLDTVKAGGAVADPYRPTVAKDIPLAKRFVLNVDEVASNRGMFYDRRDSVERAEQRVRDVAKDEGIEAARELMRSLPELTGATFKERKSGGVIGEDDGKVQFVPMDETSPYFYYQRADKATKARNEGVRKELKDVPPTLLPNDATRKRDARIRELDQEAMRAQKAFNSSWVRVVESTPTPRGTGTR